MSKNSTNEASFINEKGETVLYKDSSQATYFFDCTNSWFNKPENERWKKDNNENIIEPKIPTVPFGSFCCVLQRLKYRKIEITEKGVNVEKLKEIDNPTNVIPFDENKSKETLPDYFILTAGHNLNSSTKNYKLIKDANNFVGLELIIDYRKTYDAAILKINKITEGDKVVYDKTDASTKNDDITKSKDFYEKTIKFGKNNVEDLTLIKNIDEIQIVSFTSKTSNSLTVKDLYSPGFITEDCEMKLLLNERYGITGDSGGVSFRISNKKIIGIYLGNTENIFATFRTIPKVTTIDNEDEETRIDNSSLAQNTNITEYEIC